MVGCKITTKKGKVMKVIVVVLTFVSIGFLANSAFSRISSGGTQSADHICIAGQPC
jgi:hypothetical protein